MTYNRCGCGRAKCTAPLKRNPLDADAAIPLAMAYVKNERFGDIFDPDKALAVGTVFPELYKPFRGTDRARQCGGRGSCR